MRVVELKREIKRLKGVEEDLNCIPIHYGGVDYLLAECYDPERDPKGTKEFVDWFQADIFTAMTALSEKIARLKEELKTREGKK